MSSSYVASWNRVAWAVVGLSFCSLVGGQATGAGTQTHTPHPRASRGHLCLENVPEPRSSPENAKAQPETCSASKKHLEHMPCPREVNTPDHPGDLTFQTVVLRALVAAGMLRAPLRDACDAGGNSHRHTHRHIHTHTDTQRHTHTTYTETHTHTTHTNKSWNFQGGNWLIRWRVTSQQCLPHLLSQGI